ncbi:MAG: DUF3536 domain-containing protein [Candidatus Brocadia sp. AMX2]|nr:MULTISPECIES: DUF3536 domain-containing protein [Brocadia]MBC6933134.1 DUF3536 domain-containing protein [Candidatus Brocadia sp.]MBL1168386.1 DUF3536 domain-containing protein [Candidatus Brocadia sp. AMX1]NOG43204.1 DUF3536 domain-containing protein [Planctomycetota bacterium]GIK12440.1 MAG: glycoside hydrolase [Candidatus Brocadia sinica]KAA0242862.1 MAG: DUF3536 domain-containing protein [Candidatus Brocadia sp. AMX2]
MDRYICIHGHFYQPPRENPWLEAIEIQDSAFPYHDWNEKVNAECYAPNSASRILDGEKRIMDIVSNYARISFNFGPTLLSWMETYAPDIYQAILDADRQSMEWRSGHGNAIAQVYNHIIMPLANTRDKRTQIIWGIKDFEHRFKRSPEGIWLSETAADIETLDIIAECGIKFTILAPHQAARVRKIGGGRWKDVSGRQIDPTRAYICKLPSGRIINIFFFDGPISLSVAFEKLLTRGEDFVNRLLGGFSTTRKWRQILNIATDGESYGHHHRFGDMALSFALNHIESQGLAMLTNYGEYLEKHPPAHEVEIQENTSWSCMHGIERWKSNCGCNSGNHPGWTQEWRAPLRDAFDWLRDQIAVKYEQKAKESLKDPWKARDEYITLLLNPSEENTNKLFERHAAKILREDEKIVILKLLEIQRHAMLMYTSCGWFFDELSGLETVQVIQYAGRAIQLSENVFSESMESMFLNKLSKAQSNLPEHKDGTHVYEKFIKPAMIDAKKVGAHYAISSLFEDYPEKIKIYSYTVIKEDYQKKLKDTIKLAIGRIRIISETVRETECIGFCVLHLGDHDFNGSARTFPDDGAYRLVKEEILNKFEKGAFADIIRLMDKHFGMHSYSLRDLFKDEQRKILNEVIDFAMKEFEETYRHINENNQILMGFLQEIGMPLPKGFRIAAEFTLNYDLEKAFTEEKLNIEKIQNLINEVKRWNVMLDSTDLEFVIRKKVENIMECLNRNPSDFSLMVEIQRITTLLKLLPIEINFWYMQNIYYKMTKTIYKEFLLKAKSGDENAVRWIDVFKQIGPDLFFNTAVTQGD